MSSTTRTVDGRRSRRTTDGDDVEGTETSISDDELFHLLQNSRRRAVIRYLRGREGPIRMRDVAEQVAAWEHDTTVAQLSSDERQRVYIALYQSHLETLEDAGVIDYNKPRGVIHPRPLLDRVADYVDADRPGDSDAPGGAQEGGTVEEDGGSGLSRWSRYYLLVSGASTTLFGTAALGVSVLSSTMVSLVTVLAFVAVTFARVASTSP
jgi:hypothetical protein